MTYFFFTDSTSTYQSGHGVELELETDFDGILGVVARPELGVVVAEQCVVEPVLRRVVVQIVRGDRYKS